MFFGHTLVLFQVCALGATQAGTRAASIGDTLRRTTLDDFALQLPRVQPGVAGEVRENTARAESLSSEAWTGSVHVPMTTTSDAGEAVEDGQSTPPNPAPSPDLPLLRDHVKRNLASLAVDSPPAMYTPFRRATTSSLPSFGISTSPVFDTDSSTTSPSSFTSFETASPDSTPTITDTTSITASPSQTTGDAGVSVTPTPSGASARPTSATASQAASSDSSLAPYAHSLLIVVIILSIVLFALVVVIAVLMLRKRKARAQYIEVSELSAPVAVAATSAEDHRPYSYAASAAESSPFIAKEQPQPQGRGHESRRSSVSSISRYSQ